MYFVKESKHTQVHSSLGTDKNRLIKES